MQYSNRMKGGMKERKAGIIIKCSWWWAIRSSLPPFLQTVTLPFLLVSFLLPILFSPFFAHFITSLILLPSFSAFEYFSSSLSLFTFSSLPLIFPSCNEKSRNTIQMSEGGKSDAFYFFIQHYKRHPLSLPFKSWKLLFLFTQSFLLCISTLSIPNVWSSSQY